MCALLKKSRIKASVPTFGLGSGKSQNLEKVSHVDKRQSSKTEGFNPFTHNVFVASVPGFCML